MDNIESVILALLRLNVFAGVIEMEVVKEIISSNKQCKAEISKRKDGLFSVNIYRWERHWDCWVPITESISITDTLENSIKAAIKDIRNQTGEDIII